MPVYWNNGSRVDLPVLDTDQEPVHSFFEAFQARFGSEPSLYAAQGYDTLNVLVAAFEGRPAIANTVRKGLRDGVKNLPGVTGNLQFNDTGAVSQFPRVYRVAKDLGKIDEQKFLQAERDRIEAEKQAIRDRLRQLQSSPTAAATAAA